MKRLVIAGCGKLGTIVADAVLNGILPEYELIGVFSRTAKKAEAIANKAHEKGIECRIAESFDNLIDLNPDIMVEAA